SSVGPRVGIEAHCENGWTAGGEGRWRPLLEALAQRGLCTAAKREALLAWHGLAWQRLPHQYWLTPIHRPTSHRKPVQQPGRGLEAKGYVGFVHLEGAQVAGTDKALDGGSACQSSVKPTA